MEVHDIMETLRDSFYVSVPNWQGRFEPSFICIETAHFFILLPTGEIVCTLNGSGDVGVNKIVNCINRCLVLCR